MTRRLPGRVAPLVAAAWLSLQAGTADAAGCTALDYQSSLAAAAAALRTAPRDFTTARQDVAALLAAAPARSLALQPVLDDLTTAPPLLDDARTRLDAMSATLAYPPNSTCNEDPAAARAALHGVYASPAFAHLDDSVQPGILQSILDFLSTVFSRAAGALGPAGALLITAAAVALTGLLAWRRWHGSAATRGAHAGEPALAGDDPDAEWRAAKAAAARGDHREAVRRAFRSALITVALRGRVRIDAAWTTRELLARCEAGGDILAALAGAAALFDRAWYSGTTVSAADWQLAAERCAAVRRLARQARVERT